MYIFLILLICSLLTYSSKFPKQKRPPPIPFSKQDFEFEKQYNPFNKYFSEKIVMLLLKRVKHIKSEVQFLKKDF